MSRATGTATVGAGSRAGTGTAVVTGLGVLAPGGLGADEFWAATLEGRSAIGPIDRYDASRYASRFAGQVHGFEPAAHLPSRLIPQTDPVTRFAVAAADWALADSGIDLAQLDPLEAGVVTANASGGFEFTQHEVQKLWTLGPRHVSAFQCFAWFYAVNTGQISIRNNLRGAGSALVAEQAAGLDVLGQARRLLRKGLKVALAGGFEAPLNPYAVVSQLAHGRLSRAHRPDRAYLPFDPEAQGYVPGEGGALLVVEDAGTAEQRGAPHRYGELAGYAASFDPHPESGRPPTLVRALRGALDDARVRPDEIDVVFADAAGVPELDRVETEALAEVFGPRAVPVTAPKTRTGRLLAGGPPVDVAAALLALRDQVIPPTVHVRPSHELPLDLVLDEPREVRLRTALVLARGYGGFNSALVVRR
ncbi:ketosynthase chain-length factor [Candidatus Protofrankia californiensis]|uniref:ketosynthase chain-length factor n=1 Tax=Candidatus Protofrankia californiensis TaxID=1839754 RepID=UPI001040ECD4|nr:ketosynthase chain-length factor [Candidatus Protofrankia californiensis]